MWALGHVVALVVFCWTTIIVVQARIVPNIPPPSPSSSPDKIEKDYTLGVSKTYLINLDFRRDRLAFISKRLHDVGIPYERFSGVNFFHGVSPLAESVVATRLHPDTRVNLTLIRENFDKTVEHRRNWGSTGCWQSHLQVYFDIANGSASFLPGPFLVLEDDIDVADNLDYYLSEDFLNHVVPDDWEMLFLSTRGMTCHRQTIEGKDITVEVKNSDLDLPANRLVYVTNASQLCWVARSYLGSGYLFRNQAAIRKLIDVANTEDSTVIDRVWNPLFDTKAMIAYAVVPNPIWQRDTPSNILREEAKSITTDRVYQLLQAQNQTNALSNIKVYKKTMKPHGFTSHNFVSANDAAAVTTGAVTHSTATTASDTITKTSTTSAAGKGSDAASLRGSSGSGSSSKSQGGSSKDGGKSKAGTTNSQNTSKKGGSSRR